MGGVEVDIGEVELCAVRCDCKSVESKRRTESCLPVYFT